MADRYLNSKKYNKRSKPDGTNKKYLSKEKNFYLAFAQYVWGQYRTGYCYQPYGHVSRHAGGVGRRVSMEEIRLYSQGRQSEVRYMELLNDYDDKGDGYMNISTDIVKILPKFIDIVLGKLADYKPTPNTIAVDPAASLEKKERFNKLKLIFNPALQQILKLKPNLRPKGVNIPKNVTNLEELEDYRKMGGFRLAREIMMQHALTLTDYQSQFKSIDSMLDRDIADFNFCATHTFLEEGSGRIMCQYVDPVRTISRASIYEDHKDIDFAGFIESKTFAQIRRESDLSEKELYKVAKMYCRHGANAELGYTINYQPTGGYEGRHYEYEYDDMKIDVLTLYFVAADVEMAIVGMHNDGNAIYRNVRGDFELPEKEAKEEGKSTEATEMHHVYKCFWIVGTDYVYGCNRDYAIVRKGQDGYKQAVLPITIQSTVSPSITERSIAHVDQIQLATLKIRNMIAKIPPAPRIMLDLSVIEDSIRIAGKDFDVKELLKIYTHEGVLIYRSKNEFGDEGAANRPPIDTLTTGIAEDFQIQAGIIAQEINNLRMVTHVNEVTDGMTQKEDLLNGLTSTLVGATNTGLRSLFDIKGNFALNRAKYTSMKWQLAIQDGDIEGEIPVDNTTLELVKITKDITDAEFGIMLTIEPNFEERQRLMQELMAYKQNNTISPEAALMVSEMIRQGAMKKAQLYMAKAINEQAKINHQRQIELQQAQGQAQAQAAALAEQERRATLQVEYDLKMKLATHEAGLKKEEILLEKSMEERQQEKNNQNSLQNSLINQAGNLTAQERAQNNA